jgi:hypothetical protein
MQQGEWGSGHGLGATGRDRTADILITSEVLCHLSYGGLFVFKLGCGFSRIPADNITIHKSENPYNLRSASKKKIPL